MTWFTTRASLPLGLFLGLGAACAHRGTGPASSPSPTSGPSGPSETVTAEDIARQPGQPIEELLMGRFPGVTVMRTSDGGVSVRIRGVTTIHGSNEPLYVLDGIEIQPGPGGSLSGINPYDIESITVIKDPAGEAMYGVRGANGILIITTKRPDQ